MVADVVGVRARGYRAVARAMQTPDDAGHLPLPLDLSMPLPATIPLFCVCLMRTRRIVHVVGGKCVCGGSLCRANGKLLRPCTPQGGGACLSVPRASTPVPARPATIRWWSKTRASRLHARRACDRGEDRRPAGPWARGTITLPVPGRASFTPGKHRVRHGHVILSEEFSQTWPQPGIPTWRRGGRRAPSRTVSHL